jgi:hypothetical protein
MRRARWLRLVKKMCGEEMGNGVLEALGGFLLPRGGFVWFFNVIAADHAAGDDRPGVAPIDSVD